MKLGTMRGAILLAAMLAASIGSLVATSAEDEAFGFRISGRGIGFPVSFGTVKVEAAVGLAGPWSLTGWAEGYAPAWSADLGGDLRFTREWLSFRLSAARVSGSGEIAAVTRGEPPAWLLYDGRPTVLGGVHATAAVTWSGLSRSPEGRLTVTPSVTGVVPVGPVTVSPSAAFDLSLNASEAHPSVTGTQFSSTLDLGDVLLAHTVSFAGWVETFDSLVTTVTMPAIGLTVSAALHHVGGHAFLYELRLNYEWGNTSALPALAGKPGKICTGDVCY